MGRFYTPTLFWMEFVNRIYHLEDLSVDGMTVFRSTLKIGHERVDWYYVAQERDKSREFLICNVYFLF